MQPCLHKALVGKIKNAKKTNDEWENLYAIAHSTIQLCLGDEILFNIAGEETVEVYGVK